MSNLLHQRCTAQAGGAPMSDAAVHDHLAQLSGWHRSNGAIEKTFSFKNYLETISFVNATYGTTWLSPRGILPGRLVKIGTQVDF